MTVLRFNFDKSAASEDEGETQDDVMAGGGSKGALKGHQGSIANVRGGSTSNSQMNGILQNSQTLRIDELNR